MFLNLYPDMYRSAVLSDLDENIYCLWTTLHQPESFHIFRQTIRATPYSQQAFEEYRDRELSDPIDRAVRMFVVSRMSRGGPGRTLACGERPREPGPQRYKRQRSVFNE
ncbi:MAG TPA: hypothetical protein VNL70_01215 [Tepidisphaeraceae bacterium]|nr:hypothetical protein [Tepidisphaeraceae bacterium]